MRMKKIIVEFSCGGKRYSEEIDVKELKEDFVQSVFNESSKPSVELTFKQYTRPFNKIEKENLSKFNGNHFIYGWYECFSQSDDFPMWLFEPEDVIFVSVKHREN